MLQRQPKPRLQARTDRGLAREANEDAALAELLPGSPTFLAGRTGLLPGSTALLAVADGVGGYPGGALASQTAIAAVAAVIRDATRAAPSAGTLDRPEAALRAAFAEAIRRVREQQQGAHARMSSTLVAAVVQAVEGAAQGSGEAWIANVGDSRAYLVTDGAARQLTLDHSWVAESIRAGELSADDPRAMLSRNLITRSIGSRSEVEVDVFGPVELPPGSVLLLCSDGLHGVVDDARIAEVVAASRRDYARDLIAEVIARGAPDNVAVALLAQPGASRG